MENFRSEYRAWIPEAEMLYDESGMYYQDDQYLSSFLRRIYDQFVVSHPSHLEINIEERLMLYTGFKATDGTKIFVRDYIDEVKKRLIDVKTTANVTTFEPMNYLDQMTFYQWVIEEVTGEKYTAVLEVVDKNDYFSRSAVYEFCRETLEANRGKIIRLLEELKIAQESGIWIPTEDQQVLWSSPYYGFEGYGRMKKIINL